MKNEKNYTDFLIIKICIASFEVVWRDKNFIKNLFISEECKAIQINIFWNFFLYRGTLASRID